METKKRFEKQASSNQQRFWRLIQLETAFSCTLSCIMCPWKDERKRMKHNGLMPQAVWDALRPYLDQIASIDFSGGGEPLLHPDLIPWMTEAKSHGCQTGLLTNAVLLTPKKTQGLLDSGIDWICFSLDGAERATFESIRIHADFTSVCQNIAGFCRSAQGTGIKRMINMVIMNQNRDQLEAMVCLAAELGVDQVNFKQCDVIRGELGKGLGMFATQSSREIRGLEKALGQARKRGKKLGIQTRAFSFTPEEQPVCVQDPRDSLFIRYDGLAAPCISLAYGGPTSFLGKDAFMPALGFGSLPNQTLSEIVSSDRWMQFSKRLEDRIQAYEKGFFSVDLSEPSLIKLQAANQASIDAMPPAPEGCRVCHYLYGI